MAHTDLTYLHMTGSDPGMTFASVVVGAGAEHNLPANGHRPSSSPDMTGSDPGTAGGAVT